VTFIVEAFAWLGVGILGPIIWRALRERNLSEVGSISWTAEQERGVGGSDFLPICKRGNRVSGGHLVVRPDYGFPHGYAGFRLTRANEEIEKTNLAATVMVEIERASPVDQLRVYGSLAQQYALRWAGTYVLQSPQTYFRT